MARYTMALTHHTTALESTTLTGEDDLNTVLKAKSRNVYTLIDKMHMVVKTSFNLIGNSNGAGM